MIDEMRASAPKDDRTMSPKVDMVGSDVADLLLRLCRSNQALDDLRDALERRERGSQSMARRFL